ncbi:hypothetical protein V8C40DRAFT_235174 [Trichoderma camerunense]
MQCVRQQCLALMGFWGPGTTAMSNEWDASPLPILLSSCCRVGGQFKKVVATGLTFHVSTSSGLFQQG